MKAAVIVNPSSGRQKARQLLQRIEAAARVLDADATPYLWERPADIDALVQRALDAGCEAVVAAGGDGTVHAIGTRLIGTEVCLGVIPAGTGNAIAHHLGIPKDVEACLRVVRDGHSLRMDTATVNGQPFLAFFGFGLDAEIIQRYASVRSRNFFTYAWFSLQKYTRYRRCGFRIDTGTETLEWKPDLLTVMNIQEFGMRAVVAPGASVQDGKLDLFAVWLPGFWYVPVFTWKMFYGKLEESSRYRRLQSERFVIEREGAGAAQLDGEPVSVEARLTVETLPQSLRVLVPKEGRAGV